MATPAQVITELAAKFEALTGTRTRAPSDYRTDMGPIAAGATVYQIRASASGRDYTNANVTRVRMALEITCAHRLADLTDERAYTEGVMQADLEAMTLESWWSDMATIYGIADLAAGVERLGHVMAYQINATLDVA